MRYDAAAIMLPEADGKYLRVHALDFPEAEGYLRGSFDSDRRDDAWRHISSGKPMVLNRLDPDLHPEMYAKAAAEGMNSFCDVP